MGIYVVIENVKLASGDKLLKKDKVFSETDVSPENLERWLRKKYVRKIGEESGETEETKDFKVSTKKDERPFYLDIDYYLTPGEINKLKQADLVRYGQHIGIPDLDTKAAAAKLKKQINDFIESIDDSDDDQDEEQINENGNIEGGSTNVGG